MAGDENAESHRIWLSKPVQALLKDRQRGFVLSGRKPLSVNSLSNFMRKTCNDLKIADRVTPHDLRRTFGTRVTALGLGR